MVYPKVLAFVLAGGEGTRLYPLTDMRCKPAIPFGGRYRLVDFVLSNLVNSQIFSIYLLVQYKSQALIEHLHKAWEMSPMLVEQFITEVPPQRCNGDSEWFQGTADAVYQNRTLIDQHQADVVAVFGSDHIYRMDVRQMLDFHFAQQADVTVAAKPTPIGEASRYGNIEIDGDTARITAFHEKPQHPVALQNTPDMMLASMGNYIFRADILQQALDAVHGEGGTDFGKDVLPWLVGRHRVMAYDLTKNDVPGVKSYEERGYWCDVGTLESYGSAHRDILGLEPRFDLFNPKWPIRTYRYDGPATKVGNLDMDNSLLGAGCLIEAAKIKNSVIGLEVMMQEGVEVENCIILDYVKIEQGCKLRNAIIDRFNIIEAGTKIGYDREHDRNKYYMDESGVVVVPCGDRLVSRVY
ncbi:MAG: glucose-1-phosphate adenylyltransferase [Gammaproteobacteria bacterium]|nr:glucose-1-phosphate adenylyltransferase [Gammaproteobacteria bacterium]